jgi:hypothetical protein
VPRVRRQELDVGQLTRLLSGDQARCDLRRYFGVDLEKGDLPPYEGGRFELLDGGGNHPDTCDHFTTSDVVALKLLSVDLPARVTLDLLEGALGEEAATLLAQIPASVNLWSASAEELIQRDGAADSLWRLLEKQDGAGWVTAGKLLARKRPALIPVYDNVVRCAYGWPRNVWMALREALRQDGGSFLATLNDLRLQAELPYQITPLRVLDVAVWMRHRPVHTGHHCNGLNQIRPSAPGAGSASFVVT